MPGSLEAGKLYAYAMVSKLHEAQAIRRVLDIGPGQGTWHEILRLDGAHWTGVEVWGPYVMAFALERVYDRVIHGDARWVDWRKVGPVDLAICGDVLEHMPERDAVTLVGDLLKTARLVLISLPVVHYPQDATENPFEEHVEADWTDERVRRAFPAIRTGHVDGPIGVYLLTEDPGMAERLVTLNAALKPIIERMGQTPA